MTAQKMGILTKPWEKAGSTTLPTNLSTVFVSNLDDRPRPRTRPSVTAWAMRRPAPSGSFQQRNAPPARLAVRRCAASVRSTRQSLETVSALSGLQDGRSPTRRKPVRQQRAHRRRSRLSRQPEARSISIVRLAEINGVASASCSTEPTNDKQHARASCSGGEAQFTGNPPLSGVLMADRMSDNPCSRQDADASKSV